MIRLCLKSVQGGLVLAEVGKERLMRLLLIGLLKLRERLLLAQESLSFEVVLVRLDRLYFNLLEWIFEKGVCECRQHGVLLHELFLLLVNHP